MSGKCLSKILFVRSKNAKLKCREFSTFPKKCEIKMQRKIMQYTIALNVKLSCHDRTVNCALCTVNLYALHKYIILLLSMLYIVWYLARCYFT